MANYINSIFNQGIENTFTVDEYEFDESFGFERPTEPGFKNTLFELLEEDKLFTPTKTHSSMLVKDIK